MTSLESFVFTWLRIHCRATTPIELPSYPGATLRGGFGIALKQIVCATGNPDCQACLLSRQCVYTRSFERARLPHETTYPTLQNLPRPVVLRIAEPTRRVYNPTDTFTIDLTLFGKTLHLTNYIILAMRKLGQQGLGKQRGLFEIKKVEQVLPENKKTVLAEKILDHPMQQPQQIAMAAWLAAQPYQSQPCTLRFSTPLRIKHQGTYTQKPHLRILIGHLLRRIAQLAYFEQDIEFNLDFKGIAQLSEPIEYIASDMRWFDWERYSQRQHQSMKLGGMVGTVTYPPVGAALWEWLVAGQFTQLGKGCTFGLGQYRLETQA